MGFEMLFILGLALLIFGPKKLPQISRQVGKLLAEFRRASQEFKSQIEEEVRNLEIQVEQERLAKAATAEAPPQISQPQTAQSQTAQPQIMPPTVGETVSMRRAADRDTSFDSAPSMKAAGESGATEPENRPKEEENAETMKGQNA